MELSTTHVTLRFTVAAIAAITSSLVLTALYRRMCKTAHRVTEVLFFSVILTDWLCACAGVVAHVMRLVLGSAGMRQSAAGVAIDAVFQLTFLAAIVWTPILATFVLSGGHAHFFVRTSWLVAWTLGGVYGMATIGELQVTASASSTNAEKVRARRFVAYLLTMVFSLSLAIVAAAALVLYGRKCGFLEPSLRLMRFEKLLQYVLLIAALQLPYMLTTWLGRSDAPEPLLYVADCCILAVPILNAYIYGRQPACWRLTPPTAEELVDEATLFAADKVALEALDGLTDVAFIAEGAAGAVYKAQWLGIDVAMKVVKLPAAVASSSDHDDAALYATMIQHAEHAFIHEASICARLRHPNITLFIRAGHYEGKLGILTEYCARGSLKDVLKKKHKTIWRRKVALALDIAKGLTYLHAQNPAYIHRDLKATNILVTDTWQAKLADFGISKVANLVNRTGGNATTTTSYHPELTRRNNQTVFNELTSFAGTWRWNAPEILMDAHNCRYSRATDMYSFGMVLWEIATDGAIPFCDVQFDFEVRDRVVRGERPALASDLECPPRFTTLLTQCWAQDATTRPSVTQVTVELTALLAAMKHDANKPTARLKESSSSEDNSSRFLSSFMRNTTSERSRHPSSLFPARFTNLFRSGTNNGFSNRQSRFSTRSSTRSEGPDETFAKYASPFSSASHLDKSPVGDSNTDTAMLGLPASRRRGNSRGFEARLSMLLEYDADAMSSASDNSTAFSSSSAESIMSPIVELPVDAMLEANGTFMDDPDSRRPSLCSVLESSSSSSSASSSRTATQSVLNASQLSLYSSQSSISSSSSSRAWGTASTASHKWGLRSGGEDTTSADRSAMAARLRREYDEIHDYDADSSVDNAFMGSRIVGDIHHTDKGISAFL